MGVRVREMDGRTGRKARGAQEASAATAAVRRRARRVACVLRDGVGTAMRGSTAGAGASGGRHGQRGAAFASSASFSPTPLLPLVAPTMLRLAPLARAAPRLRAGVAPCVSPPRRRAYSSAAAAPAYTGMSDAGLSETQRDVRHAVGAVCSAFGDGQSGQHTALA